MGKNRIKLRIETINGNDNREILDLFLERTNEIIESEKYNQTIVPPITPKNMENRIKHLFKKIRNNGKEKT